MEAAFPLEKESMSRIRLALVAALAVGALLAAQAQAAAPKLVGTVGPGFTINLTKGGKKVTKLMHGTYTSSSTTSRRSTTSTSRVPA